VPLERTLETEVMDTVQEAVDYDSIKHTALSRACVCHPLQLTAETRSDTWGTDEREKFSPALTDAVIDLGGGTALIPLERIHTVPQVAAMSAVDRSVKMLHLTSRPLQQQVFCQSLHAGLTVGKVRSLRGRTGFTTASVNATSDRH